MKESELRKHTTCSICGQKILAAGVSLFWRVTVERFGLELQALNRLQGLAMMLGGHAGLASVMGPDEDLARPVMDRLTLTVCERCAVEDTCIARLGELPAPDDGKERG